MTVKGVPAALLTASLLTACAPVHTSTDPPPTTTRTTVTRVIDADTVEVGALEQPVRVVGIDAPELGTRAGNRAARWAERLLDGEQVTLERATDPHDDPYGRHLAHLRLGGEGARLYSAVAVGQGWAEPVSYPPNDRYADRLERLEPNGRE